MLPHRSLKTINHLGLIAVAASMLGGTAGHAQQAPMAAPPPGWVWQGTWHDGAWSGQWVPGAPGMNAGVTSGMPGAPGYAAGSDTMPMAPDAHTRRMIDRCRAYHHDGVAGGAIIGGVAGGVIGNRVASGDRLLGTIGGAAVGAAGGALIDSAGKHARDRSCEAFFNDHPEYVSGGPGYGGAGYAGAGYGGAGYGAQPYAPQPYGQMAPPGYTVGYTMMPVALPPAAPCVETRTTTTAYVDEPRRRLIRARQHYAAPHRKEKRVYTGS